jgi:hypothetical protein
MAFRERRLLNQRQRIMNARRDPAYALCGEFGASMSWWPLASSKQSRDLLIVPARELAPNSRWTIRKQHS